MAANKKFQLKSHLAKREEELDVVGRMVDIEFPNKRFVDPETKKPGRYHSAIVHIVDEDGVKHTWFWPRDEEGMLWTLVTEDQAVIARAREALAEMQTERFLQSMQELGFTSAETAELLHRKLEHKEEE